MEKRKSEVQSMLLQFMVNIVTDTVEDLWKHITEGVKIFILTDVKYCIVAVSAGET